MPTYTALTLLSDETRAKGLGDAMERMEPEPTGIGVFEMEDDSGLWEVGAYFTETPDAGELALDVQAVFDLGNRLARADGPLRRIGADLYGPAPAPIARIRGRHRVRLLIKAEKTAPLQAAVAEWLAGVRWKGDIRLSVDIDPQSFY